MNRPMSNTGIVYLMYHELQLPGRAPCQKGSGYVRYVIAEPDFRAQLSCLKNAGLRGMSVGEALDHPSITQAGTVITFDDGCETDLIAAAPLLREAHFNATFYIVAGHLGRRGYLSPAKLRELEELKFEIGCHSMTHAPLTNLDSRQLQVEIVEAKERLEQLLGKPVDHFSCPVGRWNQRVAELARQAGYRSVATSRIGRNLPGTNPFRLARVAVIRGISLADFNRLCHGEGLLVRQVQVALLSLAKNVLGHSYEKVRSVLLASSESFRNNRTFRR